MNRHEFVEGLRQRWRNVMQKTERVASARIEVKKWAPDSMPRFAAESRLTTAEEHLDAALCEVADFIYDTVPAHPYPVRISPSRPSEATQPLSTSAKGEKAGHVAGTTPRADDGSAALSNPEE